MIVLLVILLLAFLVETTVEYFFGQACGRIAALQPYQWLLMYVAAAVGVGGAFLYGFDLLYILGNFLGGSEYIPGPSWLGVLLTGLAIGRGSNFVHDLVSKFFMKS